MDAKAQEPAAKPKALLPSLVKAKKKLLEQAEESGVQLSGGLASDDHIPLEQIFVNLAFVSEKELKKDFDEAFSTYAESREHAVQFSKADRIELKNLFRAAGSSIDDVSHSKGKSAPAATATERPNLCGKVLRNVLAYGSAGSGKTTVFLLMVLYLWSRGELWQEEFDLVVGLELREKEVRAATSLAELLAVKLDTLGLSQTEILELANYFEDSPSRLCVIMDGLDECDFASCSKFMRHLLKREGMVKTHVIVTSRPCQDAYQLSQCGKYQQKIQVLGFSPENVREYAEKVLGRQRAEILLQSKPDVSCLMATPMFAALTCELFKSSNAMWKCSASLYESLLRRVVERAGGAVCESISLAPGKVVQSLQELGRFAFRMLVVKRMVFNKSDITNSHLSEDAKRLGLLQTCQGTMSTDARQYRFCHLSLQEFLAAWFQAECVVQERHHSIALVRRLGAYDGHMEMFWKFLIALCPEDVSLTIMEELWRVQCADPIPLDPSGEADKSTKQANKLASYRRAELASDATTKATKHAATAARRAATAAKLAEDMRNDSSVLTGEMEMAKVHDRLCQILKAEHMTVLADILLIPRHDRGKGHGGERVRRSMPISREPTDALFLKTLLTVWMENGSVANGTVLLEALSQVDAELARPCESLLHPAAMLLSRESLQAAASRIVSLADAAVAADESSPVRRLFVHLVVAYHEHAEYHGVSCNWTHPFFRAMLASKLDLRLVSLSSHECVALSSLLRGYTCSDLEEVDLDFCRIGDESFHSLSAGLQRCSSVRVLYLEYNAIHDGQALSSVISAMSASLVVVSVSCNPVGASGFVSVCRALSQCKNVHTVYVMYMYSDGAAPLSVLCDMLEQCTQLKVLLLDGNVFVGSEDDELRFIEAVKVCTQLRTLGVYDCGLSENVCSQLVMVFTERECGSGLLGV
ncbi:protein NLRC3-like [Sycon ciliatum]|uniref:protein NLRC3-like n=1 Tax=Sycon ciliatum TaxID=27933 RepID=UPI0031F6C463